MRRFITLLLYIVFLSIAIHANDKNTGESLTPAIKIEGLTPAQWARMEAETAQSNQVTTVDGVIYSTNAEGIFLTLPKASNSVKLFALTGQLIWSGDLVQGRFFIPVRPGIYFLRINNKSYKVVCRQN